MSAVKIISKNIDKQLLNIGHLNLTVSQQRHISDPH